MSKIRDATLSVAPDLDTGLENLDVNHFERHVSHFQHSSSSHCINLHASVDDQVAISMNTLGLTNPAFTPHLQKHVPCHLARGNVSSVTHRSSTQTQPPRVPCPTAESRPPLQ